MATELRQIVFDTTEIARALAMLHAASPLFPKGNVARVRIEESNGALSTFVRRALVGVVKPEEFEVSGSALAAALIMFCRSERIPVPRGADKKLTKVGSGVALCLEMDMEIPRSGAAAKAGRAGDVES